MIKMEIFHQLKSRPWQIVTSDNMNDIAEDLFSKTSRSTSKTTPSKSKPSRLWNQAQIINVTNIHQVVSLTCHTLL